MSASSRHSILVVEDDELVARELVLRLGHMGYEIAGSAPDAAQAVAIVARRMPDLALVDIMLGGRDDGILIAGQLKELGVPALYLTAYADDAMFARARITSPYAYLIKPYNDRELKLAIELALQRHREEQHQAAETARRHAAEQSDKNRQIGQLESLLSAVVEGSTDCIFAKDEAGRYLLCNRGLEVLLARPRTEILGRRDADLFPAEEAEGFRADDLRIIATPEVSSYEEIVTGSDGSRTFHTTKGRLLMNGEVCGVFGIARDVTERKQAERELRQTLARANLLAARLIDIQEAERQRLARDLHDDIGQSLTAIKILMQSAAPACPQNEDLAEAIAIANQTMRRVRTLAFDLRPPQLDDLGLSSALRSLVDTMAGINGWQANFSGDMIENRLPAAIEIACFRIAQEALTNVARHARAKQVALTVSLSARQLQLAIRDDGEGFDMAAIQARVARGESLGLLSMRERAALAGGELKLHSRPGETSVAVSFPLPEPAS